MSSRLSLARSEFAEGRWTTEPPIDEPSDFDLIPNKRPSLGKRALLALVRFLITFCIGVAATLGWQSYGDAAREKIANSSPRLGWLAPQAAAVAQAAPTAPAPPAVPAGASPDQLKSISRGLAVVRQSVDSLGAEIAKLQTTRQDSPERTSAPPPATVSPPGRKPAPPGQSSPVR